MRNVKKLGVLVVAMVAFNAIGIATASAAQFTYSAEPGELTGRALETQKWKLNAGNVECRKADMSGTLISLPPSTEQEMLVTYTECNAFGFTVHITGGIHYSFTANGELHTRSSLSFTVTGGIFGECTVTIASGQALKSVTYTNGSGLKITPNALKSIAYTSSGGICGSSGTNGELSGATQIERVGGGGFSWDA